LTTRSTAGAESSSVYQKENKGPEGPAGPDKEAPEARHSLPRKK